MFAPTHSTHKHKGNEINLELTYSMNPHSNGLGFCKAGITDASSEAEIKFCWFSTKQ